MTILGNDMDIEITTGGRPCKLCGLNDGILTIHYPSYVFRCGNFEAPEWPEHNKYYCPHCELLWADHFDKLSLIEYGEKYVDANYDHHRVPTEARMKGAPLLLKKLAALTNGTRFLDYGVGYNIPYIYELRGRGIDLWGCDISARVPYSRFIKYLPDNDLPAGTFDGLYSIDVAEHFTDIINDYLAMKDLLKPGGYMLHVTYWLNEMWKPGDGLPSDSVLRTPWHVSICSEKTMKIIAEKVGLEFVKSMKVKVDHGTAYLLKKPGDTKMKHSWFGQFRNKSPVSNINEHLEYVKKNYT